MRPAVLTVGLAAMVALPAPVRADQGRLLGWVEDTRGTPVAGVVISLFGRGLDGGGVVTLSDSAGRFVLPSLPAGSYTIRALGNENGFAAAREITVLPNQDSVFTLNLTSAASMTAAVANGEPAEATETDADADGDVDDDALRELRWLLRHKQRSVLEQRAAQPVPDDVQLASLQMPQPLADAAALAGAVEVFANATDAAGAAASDDDRSGNLGVLRLHGRLTDAISWSLAGLLAESENTTWRSAAEFLIEPGGGHAIEAGAGYGTRLLRSLYTLSPGPAQENRSLGAIFVRDTFSLGSRLTASLGARYSYIGFVSDPNHVNPHAWVEFRGDDGMKVRGTYSSQTVAPGGDLLTVSSLAAAPDVAFALVDDELRPEHVTTKRIEMERQRGPHVFRVHAFRQVVEDPLLNLPLGNRSDRTLSIRNAPGLKTTGGGVELGRRFGGVAQASISYTYGRSRRPGPRPGPAYGLLDFNNAHFHDLVGRLETVVRQTDTRLTALYRINRLSSELAERHGAQETTVSTRFDVQVTQGLPFLASMTSADWELMLAYRNLFYDDSEGAILDELAVVDPPRRIMGGIAIRF